MIHKYYSVLDFMVFDLKLKGLQKDVYAIIYGFCMADKPYTGGLGYLSEWTQSTKQGVIKALKELGEKGLIESREHYENGVKFVDYYITKFNGIKQSLTRYSTEFNEGIKQSLPNIINNNINNIIDKKENISKDIFKKVTNFHQIIKEFLTETFNIESDEKFEKVVYDFAVHRKEKKAPLTDNSLKLNLNKAYKLSNGTLSDCISLIETAIANGWQGIYKDNSYNSNHKEFKPRNINLDFDNEECKNQLKNEVIPF